MGYTKTSNNSTIDSLAVAGMTLHGGAVLTEALAHQKPSPLPMGYLTVEEAADALGYNKKTIYRDIDDGTLHVSQRRKGCHIRIPVGELNRVYGARPRSQTRELPTGDATSESGINPGSVTVTTTTASGSVLPAGIPLAPTPTVETSNPYLAALPTAPTAGGGVGLSTSGSRPRRGPPPRWTKNHQR